MGVRRLYLIMLAGAAGTACLMAAAGPAAAEKRPASLLWESEEMTSADGSPDASAEGSAGESSEEPGAAEKGDGDRLTNSGDDSTSLLGNSLAAIAVILVLGGAALFVIKRLLPKLGVTQGRRVHVIETVYLGPRKTLHVVQVGDRSLLLSGTRERLMLVADVTGSVDVPPPEPEAEKPRARFMIPGAGAEVR